MKRSLPACAQRTPDARPTLEMGRVEVVKEQIRDARAGAAVDGWLQDIVYALRLFRRAPGFTVVAVVTLALGIGANACIFSVLKSVLLDVLPYADADRLVQILRAVERRHGRRDPSAATVIREHRGLYAIHGRCGVRQ